MPMDRAAALAEARRRWGHFGYVWTYRKTFKVGEWFGGKPWCEMGKGESYEAAFADADARAKADKGREE